MRSLQASGVRRLRWLPAWVGLNEFPDHVVRFRHNGHVRGGTAVPVGASTATTRERLRETCGVRAVTDDTILLESAARLQRSGRVGTGGRNAADRNGALMLGRGLR